MFSMKYKKRTLPGIRHKVKLMQQDETQDVDLEETLDPEDVSGHEADFMKVGESHKMHEWYVFMCDYCI